MRMRMATVTRRVRLSVVACLTVALMLAPGFLPAAVPECVTAAQWVRDNAGKLPMTGDQLLQHSAVYRKYIFSAVAPEVKSARRRDLWTRTLAEMTLSPEQRQFVMEAYEAAVPALYVASTEDPIKINMRELEARVSSCSRLSNAARCPSPMARCRLLAAPSRSRVLEASSTVCLDHSEHTRKMIRMCANVH